MARLTIRNARILSGSLIVEHGVVQIEGGRIVAVSQEEQGRSAGQAIDAQGMVLAPGFIDLHVHGGNEADFMDATPEAFEAIGEFYARHGVTALQATTTAAPLSELIPVLEVARAWRQTRHPACSQLLGVHLEGPFLNVEQRGAHLAQNLQAPSAATIDALLAYGDVISEMTLAPELPGALALIRDLASRGILVSAGHSQAREQDVLAAIDAGLRHTTHIYSAMSAMIRQGPWRVPGLLETTLAHDRLTTEMIADGKHLPATLMRLVYKCKGPDRLCLVSDAMRAAGAPEGEKFLVAGQEVIIEDGVAMLADHTAFASSITPLDGMLRNVMGLLSLPLPEALRLVTCNPARMLGIAARKGSIEPGKDADLVILDDQCRVAATMIAGRLAYSRL